MWENVQCNTWKHDYPKISRDTGKKTLDKWVWIAKGPSIAALKFPVFFTRDNVKFRWSLLDRHHHLSITGEFLKSATKILVHVISPVPKQASQIQESLASFPQWNWDRKEAGNNNHSRKHSPRLMQEGTRHAAGSQHIPEGLLLKASGSGGCACCHWLPPGPLASFLSSCSKDNVCLLQPLPSCSSMKLCPGTSICSV